MKKTSMILCASVCLTSLVPLSGRALYCTKTACEVKACTSSKSLITATGAEHQSNLKQELGLSLKAGIVVEANTGKVVFSENADQKIAPASMTKLMTILLTVEKIEKGELSLTDIVTISETASAMGGSQCYLDAGEKQTIKDLLKSICVASCNDSTVALAEHISGTEELFVREMNKRANELGMINTQYKNSTGLDENGHFSSATDTATLINEVSKYARYLEGHNDWLYDFKHNSGRVTTLTNTNRLVRTEKDMLFSKTGHTDNAGFSVVTLTKRGDTSFITCVCGTAEAEIRNKETKLLTEYAFNTYKTKKVIDKDKIYGIVKLKNSTIGELMLYPKQDVYITTLTRENETHLESVVIKDEKDITFPIKQGETLGKVHYLNPQTKEEIVVELTSKEEANKLTTKDIFNKIVKNIME